MDSSRNTQPDSEGWPKYDPWRGEQRTRRSRRGRETGEEDDDSDALRGNCQSKTKRRKDEEASKDQGTINGNIPADSQCDTEGGFVGGSKNIFESNQLSSMHRLLKPRMARVLWWDKKRSHP